MLNAAQKLIRTVFWALAAGVLLIVPTTLGIIVETLAFPTL